MPTHNIIPDVEKGIKIHEQRGEERNPLIDGKLKS